MSFTITCKKSKCIKYLSDKFLSKSKLRRIKMGNIPEALHETIKKPNHKYSTAFSNLNYSSKRYSLKSTKYSVPYRGPTLWNIILDKMNKEIESHLFLKKKIVPKLLDITCEHFFKYCTYKKLRV